MDKPMDEASSGAAGAGSEGTVDWGPPPREHALAYPGRWPSGSVLLTADAHWPLISQRDRRVGLTLVDWAQGAAPPAGATRRRVPLHYALLRLGAAAPDHRVPVLAVGSTASPAQLRHKFQPPQGGGLNGDSADRFDGVVPSVIPMIEADVEGMQVGVAAQVAPYGALPATPVFGAGLSCRLFVQFLDPHQLCRIDETEDVDNPDGGYERVYLAADCDAEAPVRVRLPSGEVLGGPSTFRIVPSVTPKERPDESMVLLNPAAADIGWAVAARMRGRLSARRHRPVRPYA